MGLLTSGSHGDKDRTPEPHIRDGVGCVGGIHYARYSVLRVVVQRMLRYIVLKPSFVSSKRLEELCKEVHKEVFPEALRHFGKCLAAAVVRPVLVSPRNMLRNLLLIST